MPASSQRADFLIGWDVGGWNCDRNRLSRDAIVILDWQRNLVGTPWRGNLRTVINQSETTQDWLGALFDLCGVTMETRGSQVILAIDTPLGFSEEMISLITSGVVAEPIGQSSTNPYLYRKTERFLFDNGLSPLSAIKDMIGSQSTKGIHVLAKFAPRIDRCGVWTDGNKLTAIEAYPSACKSSKRICSLLAPYLLTVADSDTTKPQWIAGLDHDDKVDALICALVASVFVTTPGDLAQPPNDAPLSEGWIWAPADTLKREQGNPAELCMEAAQS